MLRQNILITADELLNDYKKISSIDAFSQNWIQPKPGAGTNHPRSN